jgi:hypothetical protein
MEIRPKHVPVGFDGLNQGSTFITLFLTVGDERMEFLTLGEVRLSRYYKIAILDLNVVRQKVPLDKTSLDQTTFRPNNIRPNNVRRNNIRQKDVRQNDILTKRR